MSGIEFSEDITSDQLSAFSGGEILRSEVRYQLGWPTLNVSLVLTFFNCRKMFQGGYFTHIRNTKKSSSRLKDALMENNLAVSLCLLIGQQRDCIVYKEATNVTLAGNLYDQVRHRFTIHYVFK